MYSIITRSISFLSNLLDKEDRSVRIAAGEALALIFEINRFEKFAKVNGLEHQGSSKLPHDGLAYVDVLKGKLLTQARNLSMEAGGKGSTRTDLNNQRDLFQRILFFIEVYFFPHFFTPVPKSIVLFILYNECGLLNYSLKSTTFRLGNLMNSQSKSFLIAVH